MTMTMTMNKTKKIARTGTYWLILIMCSIMCSRGSRALPTTNQVAVVVGEKAPDLEKFAASELCGYLNKSLRT